MEKTKNVSKYRLPAGDIFCGVASVDELVEGISNTTILQSRTSVHADVIVVAISRTAIKLNLGVQEKTVPHFRATETEEGFGVTVRHLVRPVAPIALRIEGQTFWTVEHVAPAVHTVHELATVLMITDLEVAVLMGTIVRRVCRL